MDGEVEGSVLIVSVLSYAQGLLDEFLWSTNAGGVDVEPHASPSATIDPQYSHLTDLAELGPVVAHR
jgi:hypothetical protein